MTGSHPPRMSETAATSHGSASSAWFHATLRPLLLPLLVLGLLALAARTLPVQDVLLGLGQVVEGAAGWGALLLGLSYTLGALLLIPGALFSMLAGFLYGPIFGALLAIPSTALASFVVFSLSRSVLRSTVERLSRRVARLRALDRVLERHGPRAVVLLRLSPLTPFGILNFAFGSSRMRARDYAWASALGGIPGGFLYAQLGAWLPSLTELGGARSLPEGPFGTALVVGGIALSLGVVIWLGHLAQRALSAETVPLEGEPPPPKPRAS